MRHIHQDDQFGMGTGSTRQAASNAHPAPGAEHSEVVEATRQTMVIDMEEKALDLAEQHAEMNRRFNLWAKAQMAALSDNIARRNLVFIPGVDIAEWRVGESKSFLYDKSVNAMVEVK